MTSFTHSSPQAEIEEEVAPSTRSSLRPELTPEDRRRAQIEELLPMVHHLAMRLAIHLPAHFSKDDLISAGILGLVDAVNRFDLSRGCSLKTFCFPRIRGAMLDELRRLNWAPRSVHEEARKLRKTVEDLAQRLGCEPNEKEICRELGLDLKDFESLLERVKPVYMVSIQEQVYSKENQEPLLYEEIVSDMRGRDASEEALRKEDRAILKAQLESLPTQQLQVLSLYYIEDLRLREIAQILEITESRVSQIHTLALSRLKSAFERARQS